MPAATRPPPWQCGHHRAGVPRARNPWCAPRSTPVDGTRGDRVCADCSPRGLSPGGQTRAAPSNPCRTTPASSASGAGITAPGADRGDGATWGSRAGRSDEGSGATPKDRDSPQPQAVKEAMQQKHATIPRQVVPGECDADVAWDHDDGATLAPKMCQNCRPDNLTKRYVIRKPP